MTNVDKRSQRVLFSNKKHPSKHLARSRILSRSYSYQFQSPQSLIVDGSVDRSNRVNSEVYGAILCGQIQPNVAKRDRTVLHITKG